MKTTIDAKIAITQLTVEFHDRFFENGNLKTKHTIDKLKMNGYEIFAISDSLEEISFIKRIPPVASINS